MFEYVTGVDLRYRTGREQMTEILRDVGLVFDMRMLLDVNVHIARQFLGAATQMQSCCQSETR